MAGSVAVSHIQDCLDESKKTLQDMQIFLHPTSNMVEHHLNQTRLLYNFKKSLDVSLKTNSLAELLVPDFDNEQIWQQLQLENKQLMSLLKTKSKVLSKDQTELCLLESQADIVQDPSRSDSDTNELDPVVLEGAEEQLDDIDLGKVKNTKPAKSNKAKKKSAVDDDFFNLDQMEEFLTKEDRKEDLRRDGFLFENEGLDIENMDDDDGEGDLSDDDLQYKDFFGEGENGDAENDLDNDMDVDFELEANEKNESKSTFEKEQEKMVGVIERLEKSNLEKKPWQLMGETNAGARPLNSLLEEHVEFDHTTAGAPDITEETSEQLEDIIKQRIKDEAWDDVERKVKPVIQPFEYKKAPELNQEKSKLSLAEVYEKEYMDKAKTNKEEEESAEHKVIKAAMQRLFSKLDALSNFSYTPKLAQPDLKIVTNTPSLQIEEVTPIVMTEAAQLAPEEIYDKKRDIVGSTEKTEEDRKRARRQKKIKKKFAAKKREEKLMEQEASGKVNKKLVQKKAVDKLKKSSRNTIVNEKSSSDKGLKSSSDFFEKLQNDVRTGIGKEKDAMKKKTGHKRARTAESLKL